MLKCLATTTGYYVIRGEEEDEEMEVKRKRKVCEAADGKKKNERFSHCWAPIGWGGRIYVLERLRFPATWMLSAMVNWMLWSMREFIQSQRFLGEEGRKVRDEKKVGEKMKERPAKKRQKSPGSNTNLQPGTMIRKNITTIYQINK